MPALPTLAVVNNNDGTVTFTVSGSTSGSTNSIYYGCIEIDIGAWNLIGSRVDDGDVTITVAPGLKWFMVKSELSGSAELSWPVPMLTTLSDTAVYEQFLQAIGTILQGAITAGELPGITDSARVQRLDYIADARGIKLPDLKVDLPAIIYGPGIQERLDIGTSTSNRDDFTYPVMIAVVDRKPAEYQADDATYLMLREGIRQLFNQKRIAGVPSSKTTIVEYEIVLDHGKDEEDMHQFATGLRLQCSTREVRWV